jgi:parvulin-like peptidyl-prolyl isomerase
MSFTNRPIFDRKHRPRWQDELRSQQLIVAAFAVAIALALGIFGATVWNSYYESHLRQVAVIDGASLNLDALGARAGVLSSTLAARAADLQSQQGGARDQVVKQQLQVLDSQFQTVSSDAASSLIDGAFMRNEAQQLGITVTDQEIDKSIADQRRLPLRLKLSVISLSALPADAKAGAKPTDAQWAAVDKEAQQLVDQLRGGADFAATAKEKSTDAATSQLGGLIGWVQAGDSSYADQFDAAKDVKTGEVLAPVKTDSGYDIVKLEDRREAGDDKALADALRSAGVSDEEYRGFIRDELLSQKFNAYFGSTVVQATQSQRKVSQIMIAAEPAGTVPIPKLHLRHILVQPLPGADDQSKATDAQWKAALDKAQKIHDAAVKPGADWFALAKQSDDAANKDNGGELGWYDPATSQFVDEFKAAVGRMRKGEISEPVKTSFGYHIIWVAGERVSAAQQATELVAQLRKEPDTFGAVARENSEDATTAVNGGLVGWVARYELPAEQEQAIFSLTPEKPISDPVVTDQGTFIYKLLATSPSMAVPPDRLDKIKSSGFPIWLADQKEQADIWVDPEFASASSSTATG